MSQPVIILDEITASQIAAGEVVERPASVVKELIENALDAGATAIDVDLKEGGIREIRVSDNGSGMTVEDAVIAFERHATSKIRTAEDLTDIRTMGFRGEALASIAAVSAVELVTRTREEDTGVRVSISGGKLEAVTPAGAQPGTVLRVRDLFYNTPARFKFLKKNSTEAGYVMDTVNMLALSRPDVSVRYAQDGNTLLHTPGDGNLLSGIYSVFGKQTVSGCLPVDYIAPEGIRVTGYLGKPEIARKTRSGQVLFLNDRLIRNRTVSAAADDGMKTLLMKGQYPFWVLHLNMAPGLFDVNVHPAKMEVRFAAERSVYLAVRQAVRRALEDVSLLREAVPEQEAESQEIIPQHVQTGLINVREDHQSEPYVAPEKESMPAIARSFVPVAAQEENEQAVGPPALEILLEEARYIGQVFNTYLVLEHRENLLLIDQHAAHERILFESLADHLTASEMPDSTPPTQILLSGEVVDMTPGKMKMVDGIREKLRHAGYIFEPFGPGSIILRQVPSLPVPYDVRSAFLDLVDILSSSAEPVVHPGQERLYTVACKAAVKANRSLSDLEVTALLKALGRLRHPYTCPHGRPVILVLGSRDFGRIFKRIL